MPDPTTDLLLPMGVYEEDGTSPPPISAATMDIFQTRPLFEGIPRGTILKKGTSDQAHFGMVGGEVAANNLKKAGWAVMFGQSVSAAIKKSLAPLIERRQSQVNNDDLFKTLDPPVQRTPRQTAKEWLNEQGVGLDVVDPTDGVPFYVMIVAPPEDVPFEFQYELDLYWGVGRLWLGENPEPYAMYANSVVTYERQTSAISRNFVLFAPDYEGKDNGAGKLLCENLVRPIIQRKVGKSDDFTMTPIVGEPATKQMLHNVLTGNVDGGRPSILFTGSHGVLKRADSPQLGDTQGAMVCQEWRGEPPTRAVYYCGADLPEKTNIQGMIHFLFACYGLGWPQNDTYTYDQTLPIAPKPAMARLPQLLLGRENGALAVLGHIDRAWSSSYREEGHPREQGFVDVVLKLMQGYRLGNATDQFNFRWAALTIPLFDTFQQMQSSSDAALKEKARQQWVRRDDARNYILHGDPAVRLRIPQPD